MAKKKIVRRNVPPIARIIGGHSAWPLGKKPDPRSKPGKRLKR